MPTARPNAYNSKNTGLDDVRNSGGPGNWYGLVTDDNGNPVVQAEGDPFPGFYVSRTSLCDRTITKARPTTSPWSLIESAS